MSGCGPVGHLVNVPALPTRAMPSSTVECSMSNSEASRCFTAIRTAAASAPGATRICMVAIGRSLVSDQTWMCDASRTPSMRSMSCLMASISMPAGAPSRRMCAERRTICQPLRTISSATNTDRIGSIGIQPVNQITAAAAIAASEPSKSPSTWTSAPPTLTLSLPPCRRMAYAARFTARPSTATAIIGPLSTSTGAAIRCTASKAIHTVSASSVMPLTNAASTSSRR